MNREGIQAILEENPELKDKIYARGFLFTDADVDTDQFPFFGKWQSKKNENYSLLVSPKQSYFCAETETGTAIILVGHAYNPVTMEANEAGILAELISLYSERAIKQPSSLFWKLINDLTGVFTIIIIDKESVYMIGDASGMQTAFYSVIDGKMYISSHTNLIGDLTELQRDPYVERLTRYHFFRLLGNALPGDLTQFRPVRRLVPNHFVRISDGRVSVGRFYLPHILKKTNEEIVSETADLLHANMELISMKWSRPAISLTGGCDSKTTLSCANGLYDRFSYFSYISSDSEAADAEAAARICDALQLTHKTYCIPDHNTEVLKYDEVSEVINWNTGNICYSHPNDVRKRIVFADTQDFDVEVKSWASEIGRAYYSKRFHGRKDFGDKPTSRKCTTLYKFFLHDRRLVKETDRVFARYLKLFFRQAESDPVAWQEQFFWEFRVPSWNGLVITGEHRYSFDITIPYNNRRILELLLSAPIQDRLDDNIYKGIRNKMNPKIDKTGIAVTNLKHTENRERLENLYYSIHSRIPV